MQLAFALSSAAALKRERNVKQVIMTSWICMGSRLQRWCFIQTQLVQRLRVWHSRKERLCCPRLRFDCWVSVGMVRAVVHDRRPIIKNVEAFPALVSCCCNISDMKDLSTVLHGIFVSWSCVRCLCRVDDILLLRCRGAREAYTRKKVIEAAVQNAWRNRSGRLMQLERRKQMLKTLWVSRWE